MLPTHSTQFDQAFQDPPANRLRHNGIRLLPDVLHFHDIHLFLLLLQAIIQILSSENLIYNFFDI